MMRLRIPAASIVGACLLTASASYAVSGSTHKLTPSAMMEAKLKPSQARMKAAHESIKEASKGLVPALTQNSGAWTAKYNLYVGCTNTPAGKTYSTIQDAVDAAYPYTVITVCPGTYQAGGAGTGITVLTSYIEIQGKSDHSGAETIVCSSTPQPLDDSWGIVLAGSYDKVRYLTFNDCNQGVAAGSFLAPTKNNTIDCNWFNDDYIGITTYGGGHYQISWNNVQDSYYGIWTEYDTDDTIYKNHLTGDGSGGLTAAGPIRPNAVRDQSLDGSTVGILLEGGVGAKVSTNTASAFGYGLELYYYNTITTVESNHLNGNVYVGAYIYDENSGDVFQNNYANSNEGGFVVDDPTNGAEAVPDSGPIKFLNNSAYGNSIDDYYDGTYPYSGDPSANKGTADYYKGNKGTIADPASIL